ncbi:putative 2-hydroxyacid dehydrogenase [Rhizodiscina lignyota]|uniref:2-hydroxyacid dehydrogenase n=1 Tax=Rhizodiscina lignyota TaxID=1504668 RepID=A0A9P4IIJ3_9PEZI|nr:putative 2-hydroxyacid dehydrogenase [Rhizodiscina lignyota]
MSSNKKPRVISLGIPKFVGEEFLSEFKKDFDFLALDAYDRKQTIENLPADIQKNGPIDALIIRMGTPPYEPFDEEMLGSLTPHCRIITSASAGFNEFDVKWMTSQGIWFCNTVDAVAEATADMAIFLTLAVLRDTSRFERNVRSGVWRGAGFAPPPDPSGLRMGIVGMGAIGKYVAKKAAVFNIKVSYYNRRQLPPDQEAKYAATYCSTLHELLSCSDIISISCPLNEETTGLIGPEEFAAMKDGAFLVNTARGAVIHETALIEALKSGKVARAGLDVFSNEPNIDPYFLTSDKVVIQPHMGGLTKLAFQKAERECFENIRALYQTGRPNSPVVEIKNK